MCQVGLGPPRILNIHYFPIVWPPLEFQKVSKKPCLGRLLLIQALYSPIFFLFKFLKSTEVFEMYFQELKKTFNNDMVLH